jgi:glycosyltransferase involved in cell wall biosynthesis
LRGGHLKIAMIHTPMLGRGGGDRQMLSLAVELQKRGHTVEIFVSALNKENSYPELLEKLNVTIVPHPLGKKMHRWLTPLDATKEQQKTDNPAKPSGGKSALREWMRQSMGRQFYTIPYDLPSMINIGRKIPKGFDVINNHNYPSEWAAVIAKKRLRAPVVWMCNEPPFWFFVPELRRGLRRVNAPVYDVYDRVVVDYIDEILVLSHIAGGYVEKAYKRHSHVVRSGIDAEPFTKATGVSVREKYGLKNNFVILQVGNIEINKRQQDAIRALQILSKSYSDVKLVFDGGGRTDELKRFCQRLGVANKVLFLRSTSDRELAEVYASCDAFVFPAQITWGLAVVEAMAAAKPVVVSKKCGVSEIIQDNINGLLVNHANPEELARKVELLIVNADLRRKLGDNAREYVKRNLSWEKYAEHMETIFEAARQKYVK